MSDHSEVLAWVNRVREEHGIGAPLDALPLGQSGSAFECPVARALTNGRIQAGVGSRITLYFGDATGLDIEHPLIVTGFVEDFDAGFIPELDEARH